MHLQSQEKDIKSNLNQMTERMVTHTSQLKLPEGANLELNAEKASILAELKLMDTQLHKVLIVYDALLKNQK